MACPGTGHSFCVRSTREWPRRATMGWEWWEVTKDGGTSPGEWPASKKHQEGLKIFHFHQFHMFLGKKGEEKMKGAQITSRLNFCPYWESISSCFQHVLDSTHDLNDEGCHIPLANFWAMQLSWEPVSGRWLVFLCHAYKIYFTIKVFSSVRRLNQITRHLNVE